MKGLKEFIFIFVIAFILALINVNAIDCTSMKINNVAYYSFDSTANDNSSNHLNPKEVIATKTNNCKIGGCYNFTATNNKIVVQSSKFDFTTAFSVCAWIKRNAINGDNAITGKYDATVKKGFNTNWYNDNKMYAQTGDGTTWANGNAGTNVNTTINKWIFYCAVMQSNNLSIYLDGKFNVIDTSVNTMSPATTKDLFIGQSPNSTTYVFNGGIDEISYYNISLTGYQINLLYNNGNGCNPYTTNATDTTPPTITFTSQTPSNISTTNAISIGLNINYTITDATAVNTTTVRMNYTVNNSKQCIDGKCYNLVRNRKPYTKNSGSNYNWFFEDNEVYNGIYLINESIMETTGHNIYTLGNANNWMELIFKNVSKDKSYTFFEGMTQNATTVNCNLQLYYCNSSYSTGNPISSPNCALFFDGINNNVYNHTHIGGKSKHKIYSLAFTNGKLNNVGVTSTSYILFRGNNICNQNIYYVNYTNAVDIVRTTSNNGNTWTTFTNKFPDAHIHQTYSGTNSSLKESVNYFIRACDTLGNCINSAKRSDVLELTNLNPTPVHIFSPTAKAYLGNSPININYTACSSPQLTNINRYLIEYFPYPTGTITTIISNNYPNLNYLWSISSISSGNYQVRVTCFDQLNRNASSNSEVFTITSYADLLLLNINTTNSLMNSNLNTINTNVSNIWSEIKMIGIIILFMMFFILATAYKQFRFLYIFCSPLLFVIGDTLRNTYPTYNTIITMLTYGGIILLLFAGIFLGFTYFMSNKDKNKPKQYGDYRDVYPK